MAGRFLHLFGRAVLVIGRPLWAAQLRNTEAPGPKTDTHTHAHTYAPALLLAPAQLELDSGALQPDDWRRAGRRERPIGAHEAARARQDLGARRLGPRAEPAAGRLRTRRLVARAGPILAPILRRQAQIGPAAPPPGTLSAPYRSFIHVEWSRAHEQH